MSYSLNHLKNMLKNCDEYGNTWKIKFNTNKSFILQSATSIYNDNEIECTLNDQNLKKVKEIKYLNMQINCTNKYDKSRIKRFYKAQRSYYGLNKYGTTPVAPKTKSFI